jgi:hypothetical protein
VVCSGDDVVKVVVVLASAAVGALPQCWPVAAALELVFAFRRYLG